MNITKADINAVVTVVPRNNPKWTRILRGEPIAADSETHLINVGEGFRVSDHCVWVKDPLHPMFDPPQATG